MMQAPVLFTPGEISVFSMPQKVRTFDWVRKNMCIVSGKYKGQLWTAELTPYAEGIMDAYDREHVRIIYILASSQTGKSTIGLGCHFRGLLQLQDNLGIGLPSIDSVKKYFGDRMQKYFKSIPDLRKLISGDDALNLSGIKLLSGASVIPMWSGSDSSMRSDSIPLLLIEEEDSYDDKNAAAIMEERADSYQSSELSKIIHVCRPKGGEDDSVIWNAAQKKAQAWCVYEARCPACMEYVRMEHENITAIDGTHDSQRIRMEKLGRYKCQHCGFLWNDSAKKVALQNGRWVSLTGDIQKATILAFHLRQWESGMVTLSEILARWFECKTQRDKQLWDNNVCAKPFKFIAIEHDWQEVMQLRDETLPRGILPDWTDALTVSIDMQMNYFLFSVAAHSVAKKHIHVVDFGRLETFEDVYSQVFEAQYSNIDGTITRGIWRASIDTGGTVHERGEDSRTVQCYRFLRSLPRRGVLFGTKGQSRATQGVLVRASQPDKDGAGRKVSNGLVLYMLNTDAFKRLVYWRITEGKEQEPLTFCSDITPEYCKQITSEKLIQKKGGGEEWKRIRANHFLDCLCGHLALEDQQWTPSLQVLMSKFEGQ